MENIFILILYTPMGISILSCFMFTLLFTLKNKNYSNSIKLLLAFILSSGIAFYFTQNALLSQSIIINIYCCCLMCFLLGQLNILKLDQWILAIFIICCLASVYYLPIDITTRVFGAICSSIIYFIFKNFFQKENPEFDWNFFVLMLGTAIFIGFSNVVFNLAIFLITSVIIVLCYAIVNKQENHKFNFVIAYVISIYFTMITITKINIKIPNPF